MGLLTAVKPLALRGRYDSIAHRGPDGSGYHSFENGFFGNVRLAIVDKASGHQPQFSLDKKFGIVFNGEIYNHDQLRQSLKFKNWQTKSDTEVLLQLFIEKGPDALAELNGMFAACIWNFETQEYWLFRDRMGIKPLYLYEDAQRFIFSSELKGFYPINNLDLTPDPVAIQDYLTYRYVPGPHSFFQKIKKIAPGELLHFKNKTYLRSSYYQMEYSNKTYTDINQAVKDLDKLLVHSVSSQLMGERPVGVLLSGGIDSSTIAFYVSKLNGNLTTFNIGFPELNEFEYSREVAHKFGLKHIEVTTTTNELINLYDDIAVALDEPLSDAACLPLFRLCQELKKEVVVVLSGEGGDELFGGYNQYRNLYSNPWTTIDWNNFMRESSYFLDGKDFMLDQTMAPTYLRTRKYWWGNSPLESMTNFDLHTWMPDNLMMKADKILMHHSLEGRFPFLDNKMLEFSTQIHPSLKIDSKKTTKFVLKKLMEPQLSQSVVHRPKMGFSVPIDLLLKEMKEKVLECIALGRFGDLGEIIDFDKVDDLVSLFYKKNDSQKALRLWTIFTLCYWYEVTLKRLLKTTVQS